MREELLRGFSVEPNSELNGWKRLALETPNYKNSKTDTEYFFRKVGKIGYLSFQGSTSKLDWKQNFDFLQVPYKRMPKKFRVHRGLLKKYKSVRDDIFKLIEGIESLKVSGFSQGGALATLLHEDVAFNKPEILLKTVVFSTPRVFSWFTPKDRFTNLVRVEIGFDIIPGLPFFIFGYKHVGNYHGVKRNGKKRKVKNIFRLSIKDHTRILGAQWTFK